MKPRPTVLLTRRLPDAAIERIRSECDLRFDEHDRALSEDQLVDRVVGCRGVVCLLTDRITARVVRAEPDLAVIANVAAGFNNIDVPAATAAGVMVTNTPGVLTGTTADLAFALLMAAARRVVEADRFAREGRFAGWEMDMMLGVDVHGATLGIIGMGRIGEAVAHRGHAGFGMRVLYHDVDRRPDLERESGYEFCSVDDLLAQSDFVSLHVPLTDRTRHLLRAPELARMRPTAVLINTSRGPVVHEEALAAALANGTIRAAGLDVFEDEPAIHPALRNLPNVVLTPHIGSASIRTRTAMAMMAVDNLLAALRGETPPRLINPEVLRPADP